MSISFDTSLSASFSMLVDKLPEFSRFVNNSVDVVRSFAANEINAFNRHSDEAMRQIGGDAFSSQTPGDEPIDPAIAGAFGDHLSTGFTALALKAGGFVGDTAKLLAWGAAHAIEMEARRVVENPLPPGFSHRLRLPPRELPDIVPLPTFGPGIARSIEVLGDKVTATQALEVAWKEMPVHVIDGMANHWNTCSQENPGTRCGASWGGLLGTAAFVGTLSPRAAPELPATQPVVAPVPRPAVIELPAVEPVAARPWSLQPAYAHAPGRMATPRPWNQMSSNPFDGAGGPSKLDQFIETGIDMWASRALGKAIGKLTELRQRFLEEPAPANASLVIPKHLRYLETVRKTIEETKATPEHIESQAVLAEMRIARARQEFKEAGASGNGDWVNLNERVQGIVDEFHTRLDDAVLRREPGEQYTPLSRATKNPALQTPAQVLPKANVAEMAEQLEQLAQRKQFLSNIAGKLDRFGKERPGTPAQNIINVAKETGMQASKHYADYLPEIEAQQAKLIELDEQVAQQTELHELQNALEDQQDVLMQIEADIQVLKRRTPKDSSEDAIDDRALDSENLRGLQAQKTKQESTVGELSTALKELKSPLQEAMAEARGEFTSRMQEATRQLDELVQGLLDATRYDKTPLDVATHIRSQFKESGLWLNGSFK